MTHANPGIGIGGNVIGSAVFNGDGNTAYINAAPPVARILKTKCIITIDHYFTGRTVELQQLHDALHSGGTAGVTQAISGLGGIGKSSLARAYANAHYADYNAIFYLNASDAASLDQSYREIDRQFEPSAPADAPDAVVRQTVQSYLQSPANYLLLVDNADFGPNYRAEDFREYLPGNLRGHVLLTTRATSSLDSLGILKNRIITLHDLEERDAATLLWERVKGKGTPIPPEQMATILAIARALYCFPLALEQAAAYIAEQEISYEEYLQDQTYGVVALLEEQQANIGQWSRDEQYRRAVNTTWAHNIYALQRNGNRAAISLLFCSAFLAPEAIPLKEIADASVLVFDGFGDDAFGGRERESRRVGEYAALLKPLLGYSLVSKDTNKGTFDIHRMLQEVIRHAIPLEHQIELIHGVVILIDLAFPYVEFEKWSDCERLMPHAIAILEFAKKFKLCSLAYANLLNSLGYYLHDRAHYGDALPLYNESLSVRRALLKNIHPSIAESLNNIAEVYAVLGDYDQALTMHTEALAIRKEVLLPNHPDIATSLNNLGLVLWKQEKFEAALPLYEEAGTILRANSPLYLRKLSATINNLALLHDAQGDYDKALTLYKEALSIIRTVQPSALPDIAATLNNIAKLHKARGDYTEALPLYYESLSLYRVALPAAHPNLAMPINNLAVMYKEQKKYDDAILLYAEALAILDLSLGRDHFYTTGTLNNAIRCLYEKSLLDNALTEDDIHSMSEIEQRNVLSEPRQTFINLVNEFIQRLQQSESI